MKDLAKVLGGILALGIVVTPMVCMFRRHGPELLQEIGAWFATLLLIIAGLGGLVRKA